MKHRFRLSHLPSLQSMARSICFGVLLASQMSGSVAQTGFSPYFERTGKGAFDQYRNTLLCAAILERALLAEQDPIRKEKLQQGVEYAIGFAGYVLESGNVVEPGGVILRPDNLAADRTFARNKWHDIANSLEQQDKSAILEELWCLQQYGHKWGS